MLNNKRRVICLVMQWASVHSERLQEEAASVAFLEVVSSSRVTLSVDVCLVILNLSFNLLFSKEFFVAVSNDAKVIPALRDQLTKLEAVVKRK